MNFMGLVARRHCCYGRRARVTLLVAALLVAVCVHRRNGNRNRRYAGHFVIPAYDTGNTVTACAYALLRETAAICFKLRAISWRG